jgi:hypothetical protein
VRTGDPPGDSDDTVSGQRTWLTLAIVLVIAIVLLSVALMAAAYALSLLVD